MPLSTQPYKGARDFYPEDKRVQKYMFATMRSVVEQFGYEEYDAPILEPIDLYLAKSGEEIVTEQTYVFEDRGGRKVSIRPEMTPTVSRMVAAKRQELAYPLRWYSIPNLWRYERPQRGRLREHWQLNVDIFGVDNVSADFEIIQVADSIVRKFGARHDMYDIKLNSRKLVDAIMHDYLKLSDVQAPMLMKLIDRMHKIEHAQFVAEVEAILTPEQREQELGYTINNLMQVKKLERLPEALKLHPSVLELQRLTEMLTAADITNAAFDITLMRGFDYYTDIVFEVFDTDPDNNRSMFGGGRYDGLVGLFGVEPVPTAGFGMGDVTLQNFLVAHHLFPPMQPETDAYVIMVGDVYAEALPAIAHFRNLGLNLAVDSTSRAIDKQIKTAVKKGLRYVLFIGQNELEEGRYMLRDLQSGSEEKHGAERLVSIVKDHRHHDEVDDL